MEYIVDIIEQQMKARQWTRNKLARLSGVPPRTVYAMFNGIHGGRYPQLNTVGDLIAALGLELRIFDPKTKRSLKRSA